MFMDAEAPLKGQSAQYLVFTSSVSSVIQNTIILKSIPTPD